MNDTIGASELSALLHMAVRGGRSIGMSFGSIAWVLGISEHEAVILASRLGEAGEVSPSTISVEAIVDAEALCAIGMNAPLLLGNDEAVFAWGRGFDDTLGGCPREISHNRGGAVIVSKEIFRRIDRGESKAVRVKLTG